MQVGFRFVPSISGTCDLNIFGEAFRNTHLHPGLAGFHVLIAEEE
jgi:hypothetical protein